MTQGTTPSVLVVIPARGGSKGIPRKNLSEIGGHPLVGRAVMAARAAHTVTEVVVSTDDVDIGKVAQNYGAQVMWRPAGISSDTASSESALVHVLEVRDATLGPKPDVIVLLQCTAPFTTPEDIDGTIELVINGGADAAFSAVRFKHFLWERDSQGLALPINHSGGPRERRQDIAPQYLEAGSVYAMRLNAFIKVGHRFCGRVMMHEVPAARCFEIDTKEELARAERELAASVSAMTRKNSLQL